MTDLKMEGKHRQATDTIRWYLGVANGKLPETTVGLWLAINGGRSAASVGDFETVRSLADSLRNFQYQQLPETYEEELTDELIERYPPSARDRLREDRKNGKTHLTIFAAPQWDERADQALAEFDGYLTGPSRSPLSEVCSAPIKQGPPIQLDHTDDVAEQLRALTPLWPTPHSLAREIAKKWLPSEELVGLHRSDKLELAYSDKAIYSVRRQFLIGRRLDWHLEYTDIARLLIDPVEMQTNLFFFYLVVSTNEGREFKHRLSIGRHIRNIALDPSGEGSVDEAREIARHVLGELSALVERSRGGR